METTLTGILDNYQEEMTETLQKLLRIPTVSTEGHANAPFGEPIQRGFDFVMALGKEKGFCCVNYDNYACELDLKADSDNNGSVGVVSHLDVVPAGRGWSFDPYGGELIGGKICGRGAVDDKGPLVAAFYACCAIKDSGLPLSKTIKHIIGTNEEGGTFPCLEYYKAHAEVPSCGIVPDSWFPVVYAEKGFLNFKFYKQFESSPCCRQHSAFKIISLKGGDAINMVPAEATAELVFSESIFDMLKDFDEKERITIKKDDGRITITALGKAAHASVPENGINAISVLLQLLSRLNELFPSPLLKLLHDLSVLVAHDTDGSGLGISYSDHTGDLTNNVGLISYQNDLLTVSMNLRSPVTLSPEKLQSQIISTAQKIGMPYRLLNYNPHFYVPLDDPLVVLLTDVYRDATGDLSSKPKAHGGGSYARALKNFIPFGPSMQNEELCFHKQDEQISRERLLLLSKIYAEALYRLAK